MEQKEKQEEDERRCRCVGRQIQAEEELRCHHEGCSFVALNKAGIVNPIHQKHTLHQQHARTFHMYSLHNRQHFCRGTSPWTCFLACTASTTHQCGHLERPQQIDGWGVCVCMGIGRRLSYQVIDIHICKETSAFKVVRQYDVSWQMLVVFGANSHRLVKSYTSMGRNISRNCLNKSPWFLWRFITITTKYEVMQREYLPHIPVSRNK